MSKLNAFSIAFSVFPCAAQYARAAFVGCAFALLHNFGDSQVAHGQVAGGQFQDHVLWRHVRIRDDVIDCLLLR